MAQDRFLQRVDSLFKMLHLERQPGNVDDIHTLTVDGYLNIHISGMDDQWILFFSEIKLPQAQRTVEYFSELLHRNLFPKHFPPIVLSYDEPTESVILWSCEMMSRLDDAELFQMFDRFFKEAEALWQEIDNPVLRKKTPDKGKKKPISGLIDPSESSEKRRDGDLPTGHIPFA